MNASSYIRTNIVLRQMRNIVRNHVSTILKIQGRMRFVLKLKYKKVSFIYHIYIYINLHVSGSLFASGNDVIAI